MKRWVVRAQTWTIAVVGLGLGPTYELDAGEGNVAGGVKVEERVLSLDYRGAIAMALQKNFELQSERYGPLIAGAGLFSERGAFDPQLEINAERSKGAGSQSLEEDVTFGSAAAGAERQRYSAGINGLLPWGTEYGIEARADGREGDRIGDEFESFAGLRLTQPLLRGFGTDVNMAPIRIARAGVILSEWELRERIMDVVTRTALTYNEICFAKENLEVAIRSQELAGQLLADNTRRAEIGVMSPLDITEARAEAAAREEDVIVARREVLDQENALKRLVSDQVIELLRLRLNIAPVQRFAVPAYELEQAVLAAFENRPDYRGTLVELQQSKIQVVVARNEVLPQIDLETSFGVNGLDRSLWSSFQAAAEDGESEWRAGVVVRMPFPNRAARGARDSRQFEVAKALVDIKNLEQEIVIAVDNASGQIETTTERIDATRVARVLARERLDAEQERLSAGTTTTFVVLELQKELAEAEVAELRALTDFNKAVITFEREAGVTLIRNRIQVEPPRYRAGSR